MGVPDVRRIKLRKFTPIKAWMLLVCAGIAPAGTISYTGMFTATTDTFITTVTLSAPGNLQLQSWGFGGGVNAAGAVIESGGLDPLLAVFLGTGDGATFVEGTSDILTNYAGFAGCPPAGTVLIGTVPGVCGDITMSLSLGAGTYTVVLSDAGYIPMAVFSGSGTLGDGFIDLTPGTLPFQTCVAGTDFCKDDSSLWAFDITAPGGSAGPDTPEPATLLLAGLGLGGLALIRIIRA